MAKVEPVSSDGLISGIKPYYIVTFLVAMVWVGVSPVLIPTYIIAKGGSATDVAFMLSVMALGAFAVPVLATTADKYNAHRVVQVLSLLAASTYALLGFTQHPVAFAVVGIIAGLGLAAPNLFLTTYIVGGGYSETAQASALALSSRAFLLGQVAGALLIASMLAAELAFAVVFTVAGSLLFAGSVIAFVTTGPLERRLHEHTSHLLLVAPRKSVLNAGFTALKDQLVSPFGRVLLGVFLAYAAWIAVNGQYSNYFYGAFGIEPEVSASANAIGALLGIATVGLYARWFSRSGGLAQFNFHVVIRIVGGILLVVMSFVLVADTGLGVLLPAGMYVLLMQLRPVQDIAYVSMAARTAPGGAAAAQGLLALVFALGEIGGNISSGVVADSFGWNWVPIVMVVMSGAALIMGVTGRKVRARLIAEAELGLEAAGAVGLSSAEIHSPPMELVEIESEPT